jgi:Asp-tRNA(Asn)/Glu-tRNA(Gln) amidotransferase A subunit family amidase
MLRGFRLLLLVCCCVACAPANRQQAAAVDAFDVIELTIEEAQHAMRTGVISCEQLTRLYLKRIEAYDQPTRLNAIIHINANAVQRARQLDRKFAASGRMEKLHCIPVILKDNFDTADMPTEAGSVALQGSLPPDDAFMVRRLRQSDAIVIAKSNMGEWALSPYHTISSTHGETRNAYDLSRVPAGSSGGTASAVSANFGIIGMGTDTGNSIRGPASHLALVGIRSTLGATSRDGIVPLLLNRDVGGPLMRTVRDTAVVYSLLAGYDPADPITQAATGRVKSDYTSYLKANGLQGARLGVLRALVDTGSADFEVLQRTDEAIEDLRRAGAVVVDPFDIPDFDRLRSATGFCSRFRYDLESYLRTLGASAPIRSLDSVAESQRFLALNGEAMQWAMSVDGDPASQDPPCVDVQGDPRRKQFLDAVVAAMDEAGIDAIVYPTWSNPPRKIGDDKSPHGNNSPVIAPHTGQPAITVPMGFSEDGLPLGLQLLARPFEEHKLFQYAYAYEQATGHRRPPPAFGRLESAARIAQHSRGAE